MANVFLSYSSKDRTIAAELSSLLQRRGLTIWWDVELIPADRFRDKIIQEIDASHVVVVLWSVDSRESSWVPDEAKIALDQNKLVQASIDGKAPPVGFGSSGVHYADLSNWSPEQSHEKIEKLLEAIEQFIPPADSVDALKKRIDEVDNRSNYKSAKTWMKLATVLSMSGILYTFYSFYISSNLTISDSEIASVANNVKRDSDFIEVVSDNILQDVDLSSLLGKPGDSISDPFLQAQAMCFGIASSNTANSNANDSLITAVSRPRIDGGGNPVPSDVNSGIVSCETVCSTVPNRKGDTGTQTCFGGAHLYTPNSNEFTNKPGAAFPYQAVLYNPTRCNVDWFGPNFCCCQSP